MFETTGWPANRMSRCEFIRGAALGISALAMPSLLAAHGEAAAAEDRSEEALATGDADALHRRVRAELKVFTDWLAKNGVQGYIGEVGWPDDVRGDYTRWNTLAEAWFEDADAADLWVTVWATGEWWKHPYYPLAVYENRLPGPGVDTANTQAPVVEAHPTTESYLRGVCVAGAEFGTPGPLVKRSRFSNTRPGVYDTAYHYDSQETFTYLAGRGIQLVRLAFRWERLQRTLGGELNTTELERLKGAVARARNAGLDVLLDMHGYGAYQLSNGTRGIRRAIGTTQVTHAHLADVWRRISTAFKEDPGVIGYGIMNEPVAMPSSASMSAAEEWELASQEALDAIRGNDDMKLVTISGYEWAGVQEWPKQHPDKWITDAANNHRYEGHHYWDRNNSGEYSYSYAEEIANAQSRGY